MDGAERLKRDGEGVFPHYKRGEGGCKMHPYFHGKGVGEGVGGVDFVDFSKEMQEG
jgi:hypothetical protein